MLQKIWSWWRNRNRFHSLDLEEPCGRLVVPPLDGPKCFSDKPYRLNAPRPFYVGAGECLICGAPHAVAPDLMAWAYDASMRPDHCYFRKQPVTTGELDRAIKAIDVSCCGALRYSGDDPEIKKRLGI